MNISLTVDLPLVRAILMEPDIWERAAEDCVDKETFYPRTDLYNMWLLCEDDEDVIGLILVHTDTSVSVKIHPYLRKNHRHEGRKMMAEFYKWFIDNTKAEKVSVSIPEYEKRVINFSKKVGFTDEGINRLSYRKNGHLFNLHNLGITRQEIEDRING